MRKLAWIAAIAFITGIGISQPAPADPPAMGECLICDTGEWRCYSYFFNPPCEAPEGVPPCTSQQYTICMGG
jgi:hypothetical protein